MTTPTHAQRAARGLLVALLLWLSQLTAGAAYAQTTDDLALQLEVLDARIALATLYEPIERAREAIDRRAFDVDALAIELAFDDAETIAAAVRAAVRFEPYAGVLRGASGTLASGGGNAADQALLLAVLLGDAGYEVELRRALLDDEGVAALLVALSEGAPRAAASRVAIDQGGGIEADRGAEEALAEQIAAIERDVGSATARLGSALLDAALADVPSPIADAMRDYVWVAYRLSAREPWTDLHVLLEERHALFEALEPSSTATSTIPEDWTHRVSVQAFVERRRGDAIEAVPIMDPFVAPTANLYGVPLTFATAPDGAASVEDPSDIESLRAATSLLWPVFRGDTPAGAMAFDLLGNTVPPLAASSPFASIFQGVASAAAGATSLLDGLGVDGVDSDAGTDAISLTGVWLDIALIAPDGTRDEHRRYLLDRRGHDAREAGSLDLRRDLDDGDVFEALLDNHTMMLDPGRYVDAYVFDRTAEALLLGRDHLDAAHAAVAQGHAPDPMPLALRQADEAIAPLLVLSAMGAVPVDAAHVVTYRPSPGLVILSSGPTTGDAMVDVVANPRWSLRIDGDAPQLDRSATLAAGAYETRVEGVVLDGSDAVVSPAYELLASGAPLRVFTASDADALAALPFPEEARAAMLADLARGHLVVSAERPEGEVPGWWRYDPVTGALLGKGGDGRGLAFTEYLINNQISMFIAGFLTGYGMAQCTSISSGWRQACCMVQNAAIGAAGVGLGYAIAAGIATTVYASSAALNALLIVKMDIQVGVGTTFIPPVCGTD
jgi:hypothetical protein